MGENSDWGRMVEQADGLVAELVTDALHMGGWTLLALVVMRLLDRVIQAVGVGHVIEMVLTFAGDGADGPPVPPVDVVATLDQPLP
jgi:hypothetical protein